MADDIFDPFPEVVYAGEIIPARFFFSRLHRMGQVETHKHQGRYQKGRRIDDNRRLPPVEIGNEAAEGGAEGEHDGPRCPG